MHAHLPRRGVAALPVNTQMGLGHERFDQALDAWASDFRMSESNHRQFYGRWAQLMKRGKLVRSVGAGSTNGESNHG